MSGPTLFSKGKLVAHSHSESQDVLDTYRPIDYIMNWFESRIGRAGSILDRILVLMSSTGSGKSTVVPPEFYHKFFERTGRRNICCTQPRVLTSIEIPKTIIPFHTGSGGRKALVMGENIGFQNGVIEKRPTRGMIFMTVGVLQQQLNIMSDEEFMRKYSIIIIDEAHERSIGTDLTMYAMKALIERNYKNPECPFLVTMSATFDPHKFADYLLSSVQGDVRYKNIISVSGFSYPITEHFLEFDSSNYIQAAVDQAVQCHVQNLDDITSESIFRDILIFVAGVADAEKILFEISECNNNHPVFMKYRALPIKLMGEDIEHRTDNYVNITKPLHLISGKPVRRIIVASNVAETGITIDTLKYVIDTGFLKSAEYDPIYRSKLLVTRPVTQSMYMQRRGRVGRKSPGNAYGLYSRNTYELLQKDQWPEIVKEDTSLDLLSLLVRASDPDSISRQHPPHVWIHEPDRLPGLGADFETFLAQSNVDIFSFDLIDLPSADSMHASMDRLLTAGAININSTPTLVGVLMSKFRFLTLESIRSILAGYAWDAPIIDLITIAAAVGVMGSPLIKLKDKRATTHPGDLPSQLDLYLSCDFLRVVVYWYKYQQLAVQSLTSDRSIQQLCEESWLEYSYFTKLTDARADIIRSMAGFGMNPYHRADESWNEQHEFSRASYVDKMKKCLYEGYKSNVAIWNVRKRAYETRAGKLEVRLIRSWLSSGKDITLYGGSNPHAIMYNSLSYRQNMRGDYPANMNFISALDGFVSFESY